MKNTLFQLVEKIRTMPLFTKIVIYIIIFIVSHFSISVIYQLAMYNYSLVHEIPYLYARKISVIDLYPSILYLKLTYIVFVLVIFYGVISIKDSYSKIKYDFPLRRQLHKAKKYFVERGVSTNNNKNTSIKFTIFTSIVFFTYLLIGDNIVYQQVFIISNPRSWCKLLILKELIINQLCCKLLFYK